MMNRNISSLKDDDRFHFGPVYQFTSLSSSSSSSSSYNVNLFTTNECCGSQVHGPSHHHEGGLKAQVWKSEEDGMRLSLMTSKKRGPPPYSCSMENDMMSSNYYDKGSSFPIRVCADCSTNKTPLWRSGPNGPKSLCNACGIRRRKARRAMAGEEIKPLKPRTKEKEKKRKETKNNGIGSRSGSEGRFEEVVKKVRKSLLGIQRVFPEDEKDAAILLMALSLSSSSSSSSSIFH